MVNSSMLDSMTKLVTASLPAAPGPMLGEHGRLDPGFKFGFEINGKLQKDLDDVVGPLLSNISAAKKDKYAFAVVDLTEHPGGAPSPAYAGVGDTRFMFIASLAKILPLYAAYQLRSDLRYLKVELELLNSGPVDINRLAVQARLRYDSMRASSINLGLPKIETFFEIKSNGVVDFTSEIKSDSELDTFHQLSLDRPGVRGDRTQIEARKARELLRLMAGWSDNIAASLVIRALGFKYLWSLTNRSGLYRSGWNRLTGHDTGPLGSRGLFIGRDYGGLNWGNGSERRIPNAPIGPPTQAGTARSVAYLLTMLAQERLLNHVDHCGMYEMLRKNQNFDFLPSRGENSPIGIGTHLDPLKWDATQLGWESYDESVPPASVPPPPGPLTASLAVSKIGMAWVKPRPTDPLITDLSNVLLVRTHQGAVYISAVLVVIDNNTDDYPAADDDRWDVFFQFGQEMAKKLMERHGVPVPVVP